jgi:hypothetical protein
MLADTLRTCEIYTKATAAGEDAQDVVGYLATWFGVLRPAIYKRLRQGGALPPYKHPGSTGRNAAGIRRERKGMVLPPPVQCRDPCPRCGVRRDFGCRHSLERLGTVL